jgi:hypothetical protein
MKITIAHLIVLAAFSFGSAAMADTGMKDESQPAATEAGQATAAPAEQPQSAPVHSTSTTQIHPGMPRPMNLDLRHCLDLADNLAIARCANE